MTNLEILNEYMLDNGLLDKCLEMQFAKAGAKKQYLEDLKNDLVVEILQTDNEKLNNVVQNKHVNAWLTRLIQNNLFSNSSWFWRRYIRPDVMGDEITERELDIPE